MLYLLGVVVAAARLPPRAGGRRLGPEHRARSTSSSCRPYYTFAVSDVRYVLTFGVMLAVALVMSTLTGRIRNAGGGGPRSGSGARPRCTR